MSATPQSMGEAVASQPQCVVDSSVVNTALDVPTSGPLPRDAAARQFVCPRCGDDGALGGRCAGCELFYVSARSLEQAPPRSWLGHTLADRFAILGMLGAGGMGVVYWAVQHPVGRLAAVKVLRSDLTGSVVQERFLREATTIAGLQHPHVITCFDYGLHDDRQPYMALELLHGISLEHCADELTLDLPTVVHIMEQVLEGIAAFHDAGIVHRDLKPDNVMLCRIGGDDTFVKIIDFGLALRLLDSRSQKLTQGAEVFGTPLFMSPEQAVGSGDVGPASDVYSFGVMLYELLTGRVPFSASAPMKVMLKHIHDPPPKLVPREGVEVPVALETFVMRCLAKGPEDRFPDGRAALDAFRALELPNSGPVFLLTDPDAGTGEHDTVAFAQSAELAIDLPNTDTVDLEKPGPTRRTIEFSWPPVWWDPDKFRAVAAAGAGKLAGTGRRVSGATHPGILAGVLIAILSAAGLVAAMALWPDPEPPRPPEIEAATGHVGAAISAGSTQATTTAVEQEMKMRNAKKRLRH